MGKMNKGRPPQQNLSKLGVEINKTKNNFRIFLRDAVGYFLNYFHLTR